jgi:hypothetical protein
MNCKTCYIQTTPMDCFHKTFENENDTSYFCSMYCLKHYHKQSQNKSDNVSVKELIKKFSQK